MFQKNQPSLHFETRAFSYQVLFSTNLCSKREEGEFHNLEALKSAWNTDDGDTVYNADYKIRDCHFPTAEECPYRIGNRVFSEIQSDLFAKRSKREFCRLEALDTKRYAYDRNTQYYSAYSP